MISLKERKEVQVFKILGTAGLGGIIFGTITESSICVFYNITGIPCPSCGMTRAFLSLFRGDILEAFSYHQLFPLIFITPFILKTDKEKYIYVLIAVFLITWIVRLILLFPHTQPMVYNNKALLPYAITLVKNILN